MPKTQTEANTKKRTSSPQQHRPRIRSPDPEAQHPAVIIQRARVARRCAAAAEYDREPGCGQAASWDRQAPFPAGTGPASGIGGRGMSAM